MAEDEVRGRPLLDTSEFWRKEEPMVLEVLPGLTRRADEPPRTFEVPKVVVIVAVDMRVLGRWVQIVELCAHREVSAGRTCFREANSPHEGFEN